MEIKDLSIVELESYYNLVEKLIDDAIRRGKMNNYSIVESGEIQRELNKYNNYRGILIREINNRFDETFNR